MCVGENIRVHAPRDAPTPSDLVGEWVLARRLADRRTGHHGTVRGRLLLHRHGDRVDWAENGTLSWDGTTLAVSRHYVLRRDDEGWWVYFPHGGAFHPWRPGAWVEHPCRADRYRGLITVDDADHWRTLWEVAGPGKSQRIITRFARPPC